MGKTVVKRIPVEAIEKINQFDSNFQIAILKALDIKAPNQQIQSKGLTKEQRMEVEDLIETKIEQAKRGY